MGIILPISCFKGDDDFLEEIESTSKKEIIENGTMKEKTKEKDEHNISTHSEENSEEEEQEIHFTTKSQHSFQYSLKGIRACTPISISVSCGFLELDEEIFDCITDFNSLKAISHFFKLQETKQKILPEIVDAKHVDDLREILLLKWIKRGVNQKSFGTIFKRTSTNDQQKFLKKLNLKLKDEKVAILDEKNWLYNIMDSFEDQFNRLVNVEYKNENFGVILTANNHTTTVVKRNNILMYFDSSKSEGVFKKVSELIITKTSDWKKIVDEMKSRWKKASQCDFSPIFITRNS